MTFYQKSELPGGLRVITEEIPHVRSASVGVWVGAGSRFEQPENMGISHLIEHMLFKGTETRNARQIAQAIEGRGGLLNAFTSKEQTCYYARTLDVHLPLAIEVLGDMLQHSRFEPAELDKEKGVIVEEIKMYEDVPDDLVHDLFATILWSDHALGRPIVGTAQTITDLSRSSILDFYGRMYTADNIVVAAAGNLHHEQVVAAVMDQFGALPPGQSAARDPALEKAYDQVSRAMVRHKETEQTHLVIGMNGLAYRDSDLYALHLLNTVVGGGTSSRLFQEIRENRGLAYSVYSFQSSFADTGNFGVYAGTSHDAAPEVLELILQELTAVGKEGLTAVELAEAKDQLKGQIMLSLESSVGRMSRLGRGELNMGHVLSPDEIINRIDAVTLEGVHQLADRLLLGEPKVLALVGPQSGPLDLPTYGFAEVQHG